MGLRYHLYEQPYTECPANLDLAIVSIGGFKFNNTEYSNTGDAIDQIIISLPKDVLHDEFSQLLLNQGQYNYYAEHHQLAVLLNQGKYDGSNKLVKQVIFVEFWPYQGAKLDVALVLQDGHTLIIHYRGPSRSDGRY